MKQKRDRKNRLKLKSLINSLDGINIVQMKQDTFKKYSNLNLHEEDVYRSETRKDILPEETRDNIKNFYMDNSRNIPFARHAGKMVLTDTLQRMHKEYNKENESVSLSAFKRLRPRCCLTVSKDKFIGAMCEYCIYMEYVVSIMHLREEKCQNKKNSYNRLIMTIVLHS